MSRVTSQTQSTPLVITRPQPWLRKAEAEAVEAEPEAEGGRELIRGRGRGREVIRGVATVSPLDPGISPARRRHSGIHCVCLCGAWMEAVAEGRPGRAVPQLLLD